MRFRDEDYLKAFPREKPKRVRVEEKKIKEEETMTNKVDDEEVEEVEIVEEKEEVVEDGNGTDD